MSSSPRAVLAVLAAGSFATGTDSFVIAGVLPAVADDLGTSVTAVGVTVALFAVTYAVAGPVLVAVAAHHRPQSLLTASMFVFTAGNVAAAAAPTVTALGAARMVAAVGAGVFVPTALAVAAEIGGPDRRGRSTAAVVGGASVALVLGAPLGTMVAAATSWRGSFVMIAVIGVAVTVGTALVVNPASGVASPPTWSARLALMRRPDVLAVLAVTVLANTAAFSVYPYLAVLFPDVGRNGVAALVFSFGIGAIVGTWLGGKASDAFPPTWVAAVAVALFAVDHLLLGIVAGSFALGIGYALVWGLSGWATVPAQQGRLLGRTGSLAPLALSLNSSAIHLGTGLGALAGGAIVAGPGAGSIWIFASVAAFGAVALVPVGDRTPVGTVRGKGPR